MKKGKKIFGGKSYSLVAMLIIGLIAFSIIVVAGLLFSNYESITRNEVIRNDSMSNHYVSNSMEQNFNSAWVYSNRIYNDIAIKLLMNHLTPNIYQTQQAFSQLTDYHQTNGSILSIYVYNACRDTLYVESGRTDIGSVWPGVSKRGDFPDPDAIREADNYSKHLPYIPFVRTLYRGTANQGFCYSFLIYNYRAAAPKDHYVMVNFNYNAFFPQNSQSSDTEPSGILVVDSNGVTVTKSRDFRPLQNISSEPYIRRILDDGSKTGCFTCNIDGSDCLVTFDKDNRYNWAVVSATPWSTISEKTSQIRSFSLLSLITLMAVLALVVYRLLHGFFSKLNEAVTKLSNTQKEASAGNAALGNFFLRDLLLGKAITSEKYISFNMKKYSIPFGPSCNVLLILLHADATGEYSADCVREDWETVKEKILAESENLSRDFTMKWVEVETGILVLIVNGKTQRQKITREEAADYIARIRGIGEKGGFTLSASISEEGPFIKIHDLYYAAAASMERRFFLPAGCTIFVSDSKEKSVEEYIYPVKKEKQLINCLVALDKTDAEKVYHEIMQELQFYPKICTEVALIRLTDALNRLLKQKETEVKLTTPISAKNIFQVDDFFLTAFRQICSVLNIRKDNKHSKIILQIDQVIYTEYTDHQLSIDYIADKVQLSASYISRIYKQLTGCTILDKIMDVRIGKSIEMLLKARLSVSSIAEVVGFSSASYFNNVFKRFCGQTPNQFRKAHSSEPFEPNSFFFPPTSLPF